MKMREYLFRGKSVGSGDWIEGYLNQHRGEKISDCYANDINSNDFYINDWVAKIDTGLYGLYHKVLPETIGQYTGLTDRNGKRIFEGDILNTSNSNCRIWYVDYKHTAFCVNQVNANYCCLLDEFMQYSSVEVIGNIHDNPELME